MLEEITVTSKEYREQMKDYNVADFEPLFDAATAKVVKEGMTFVEFLDAPRPNDTKEDKLTAIYAEAQTMCIEQNRMCDIQHINNIFHPLMSKFRYFA